MENETENTVTLSELCAKVKITAERGAKRDWSKLDEWQKNAIGYRVTLAYQGRKMSLDFWQGTGCKEAPTADGVMDCLLSDSIVDGMDFQDWCDEYGYDSDSRKHLATYQQCQRQTKRVKRLLGADFEAFLYSDH